MKEIPRRLHNLDYLRGIAASLIMLYHFLSWGFGEFSAQTFMGRIGIYGVAIFYILSSLTLYYVYFEKSSPTTTEIIQFFKKRVFRIFPLLWLVTLVAIILSKTIPNFLDLFLNLSGLFGFFKWDTYFSAGIWSIGNELVFYSLFPIMLFFTKKSHWLMAMLVILSLGIYIYIAFNSFSGDLNLSEQWRVYINPLNQFFLFIGGFLIAHFFNKHTFHNAILLSVLGLAMLVFIFYPTSTGLLDLVIGVNRLVFTFLCFAISFCFLKITIVLPPIAHKPLVFLGEISYSLYLLHPIVWAVLGIFIDKFHLHGINHIEIVKVVVSFPIAITASYISYVYFEKFFVKFGKSSSVKSTKPILPGV